MSSLLLFHKKRFVDEFAGAALSSRWSVVAGTFDVSGGALRATGMADWLGNLVTNGESWTGGPPPTGWVTATGAIHTAPDSAADPGDASTGHGAINDVVGKVVASAALADVNVIYELASLVGAQYRVSTLFYVPAATVSADPQLRTGSTTGWTANVRTLSTVRNAWQTLQLTNTATTATAQIRLEIGITACAIDDVIYADTVAAYRQNAAVVARFGPNPTVILSIANPAAPTVTPFGWLCRYQDSSNYWEVRVTPNTAGTDLQLIEVVAGVETVRGSADVDFTASATDKIRIKARGTTITVDTMKSGETVWTQRINYASATNFQTAAYHGPLYYGTATNPLVRVEVIA